MGQTWHQRLKRRLYRGEGIATGGGHGLESLKIELVDGKYKLSKKTNNTWNFMLLSEVELKQILKLIEQEVTK